MVGQVENAAQTIALDAADKILVNDLVALQRMLDLTTVAKYLVLEEAAATTSFIHLLRAHDSRYLAIICKSYEIFQGGGKGV